MFDISIVSAFLAGLLSFVSPCILPIVPFYLSYLAGVGMNQISSDSEIDSATRRRAVLAAMFFAAGVITIFMGLGAAATSFGQVVREYFDILRWVAAAIIITMGLHFLGVIKIALLYRQMSFDTGKMSNLSLIGSYVVGLAFAFGWTPCLGPILGTILALAADTANPAKGVILLATYAAGLGIPFVLVAVFFPSLTGLMAWMKRHMMRIERIMGLLLWTVGLMMVTGQFTQFSWWILEQFPALSALG